ncbi:hypothetical protein BHE74_00052254 [Ensete ventricosum]|nr:hypothetical protein GW17_00041035 [Ensete ventricosum]RWW42214.1 hypothetical protein BHE74_00052254 [Ensete ventricosum]
MLATAEGEKGNGGNGRSSDGGFWGRTTRDSFVAVLVLPTKVVSGCGMAMRPRAAAAMVGLHEDGYKIFGGEVAAKICGIATGTPRIVVLIPIDRNPWGCDRGGRGWERRAVDGLDQRPRLAEEEEDNDWEQ